MQKASAQEVAVKQVTSLREALVLLRETCTKGILFWLHLGELFDMSGFILLISVHLCAGETFNQALEDTLMLFGVVTEEQRAKNVPDSWEDLVFEEDGNRGETALESEPFFSVCPF